MSGSKRNGGVKEGDIEDRRGYGLSGLSIGKNGLEQPLRGLDWKLAKENQEKKESIRFF